ncbi:MAG TPA: sulfur carrier protein ThiS [Candidatus Berkiella sp.]|nr:sulfur carrier protein ThiS [Candidatus Berkiella sp.]
MNKISIKFNHQMLEVELNDVLNQVLQNTLLPSIYAIAVNGKFLAKAQYAHYQLKQGDEIAVLTPMQGG